MIVAGRGVLRAGAAALRLHHPSGLVRLLPVPGRDRRGGGHAGRAGARRRPEHREGPQPGLRLDDDAPSSGGWWPDRCWPGRSTTWAAGTGHGPSTRSSCSGARSRSSTAIALLSSSRSPSTRARRRAVKVKHPPYRQLVTKTGPRVPGGGRHRALRHGRVRGAVESLATPSGRLRALHRLHLGRVLRAHAARRSRAATWPTATTAGRSCSRVYWSRRSPGSSTAATTNLTLFLIVNVDRRLRRSPGPIRPSRASWCRWCHRAGWGACRDWSRPPCRWRPRGTLVAPVLYEYMSGYVISLAGVISLVGLALRGAHPLPGVEEAQGGRRSCRANSLTETIELALRTDIVISMEEDHAEPGDRNRATAERGPPARRFSFVLRERRSGFDRRGLADGRQARRSPTSARCWLCATGPGRCWPAPAWLTPSTSPTSCSP